MSEPVKVLHTGDTHLGYRQYGSDRRREDFLKAFEAVVDDAVEGEYDVFVHSGDLFHSRNPALVDVIPTVELFERLRDAGVQAFAVVGNHESKRDAQWIDLLESLGLVERLGREPIEVGDVAFYGVDYVPKSRIESFEHDFQPSDASYSVMVAHGRFEPFPYGEWPLSEFVERGSVEWDTFLLGDYHHHERREIDGVPAEYCGSTERASAEERESRGYNVVEFTEAGVSFSRRSLEHATREFVFVEVDVSGVEGDATGYVVERVLEHPVEDSAVVVYVEGDGDADVVRSEVETAVETEGAVVVRTNDRREMEDGDEADIEVSFADPDDAVQERVADMELSQPAIEVDHVVRGDDVADTNIADEVESRVQNVVEDGWTPNVTEAETADPEPEPEPSEKSSPSDDDHVDVEGSPDAGSEAAAPEIQQPETDEASVGDEPGGERPSPLPDEATEPADAVTDVAGSAEEEAGFGDGSDDTAEDVVDEEADAGQVDETVESETGGDGGDEGGSTGGDDGVGGGSTGGDDGVGGGSTEEGDQAEPEKPSDSSSEEEERVDEEFGTTLEEWT